MVDPGKSEEVLEIGTVTNGSRRLALDRADFHRDQVLWPWNEDRPTVRPRALHRCVEEASAGFAFHPDEVQTAERRVAMLKIRKAFGIEKRLEAFTCDSRQERRPSSFIDDEIQIEGRARRSPRRQGETTREHPAGPRSFEVRPKPSDEMGGVQAGNHGMHGRLRFGVVEKRAQSSAGMAGIGVPLLVICIEYRL